MDRTTGLGNLCPAPSGRYGQPPCRNDHIAFGRHVGRARGPPVDGRLDVDLAAKRAGDLVALLDLQNTDLRHPEAKQTSWALEAKAAPAGQTMIGLVHSHLHSVGRPA